jgi:hypothetical protein
MNRAASVAAVALLALVNAASAANLGITINGRTDQVYDNTRNLLYFSTNAGQIQRYNPVTNALLPAWNIGSNLHAIDITPDRQYLFAVQDGLNAGQGTIYRVDLNTGASTPFTYTAPEGAGPVDIVTLNDGRAVFSASHMFSGASTPLRSINYATGAISPFTINGTAQEIERRSPLYRNLTQSTFMYTGGNTSAGPLAIFSTATQNWITQRTTGTDLNGIRAAISPDGTDLAMYGFNFASTVRDTSTFSVITPMADGGGGFAYSPDGATLYTGSLNAGLFLIYRTSDYQQIGSFAPGATLYPYEVAENALTITDDGSRLYYYSTNGLNVYAVPEPASLLATAVAVPLLLLRRRAHRNAT